MREQDFAVEFLRSVLPFGALGTDALEAVAAELEAAYYPSGKTILDSRNDPGLAIIRKGAVRLVDPSRRFLDRRSEGEVFGHRIHFHGEASDYLAEAQEDCLVWHLPQARFEALCQRQASVAEHFDSHHRSRLSGAAQARRPPARLRDLLQRPPVTVEHFTSVHEAAGLMSREDVSSVLVMRDGALAGIVTDKDLRRRVLAAGEDPGRAIEAFMTAMPVALDVEAGVDDALLLMMRQNCRHLPIMDGHRPLGLLTAGDILRSQSEHPLRLVKDIHRRESTEELETLSRRLPALFVRMVSLGRDAERIGRMFTQVTDAFTVCLLQLAERSLGAPPLRYAWVAFGSQAREEQTARTDQDNGLVLEREANGAEARYFAALSQFVCGGLDRLGYDYCPGEVMAMNPKWRVSLAQWRRHFDTWIDQPEPQAVMHSSIFFDMRCVYGEARLVEELLAHAVASAAANQLFRRFMAANVLAHRPPIGFFRRFVQEEDGSHSEGLNLKHRGVVPIVDLVRMRALEAGISVPNTYRRLEQAVAGGALNESDAGSLRDALNLVGRLRLEHQAAQMAAGEQPGNIVPPEELSPLMRRNLKAAFMLVVEAQRALALRYQLG